MHCPSCGFENSADANFCGECAAPLIGEASCPACGRANPVTQKFCSGCGKPLARSAGQTPPPDPRSYTPSHLAEKILSSRSAIEGERKQVTVLFADLKGSMDLSESLDPEEWHKIMGRFFQILAGGVHRFEGTVNQYTGDGIMALFGAPIAHEDHAARACYAALSLREDLRRYATELRAGRGIGFSVRMGLNSGEVVVGKIGDDLRMDYTALGHTTSLGARMEQIAAPDRTNLSEHTAKLVEGLVQLEDLGKVTVKGVKEPLRVYELREIGRLRTRLEVSHARGFSKFVGRGSQMAVLEAALEQAIAGSAQVVGIVADPGVGKSRLCLEFVARCRQRGVYVNEGHCLPHGKVMPYLPVLELWRSYFGIGEKDSDEEARRKIAGTMRLLDEGLRDTLPTVFEFLGVPDPDDPPPRIDPEAKQRQLFSFLRRFTQSLSEREPFVILIDDLHWIDRASDAFVAEFAEAIEGRRVLFLVNFRPEYAAPWMQRRYYQQISLSPLSSAAVEELLDDLLGTDSGLAELRERMRSRTGGNPLFLEEIALSLTESGVLAGARGSYRLSRPIENVGIPATVHALLAARIDRLSERDKAVLHAASVVGKNFSESILRRVANLPELELVASLRALRHAEFVHEEAFEPETVYAFKHPLTHEVAYKTQLGERRKHVHAAVARAIEEIYPDKVDERAALVAHHWEAAGDVLQAARWNRRAAQWAGTNAPFEALRHWMKVRELAAEALASDETRGLQIAAYGQTLAFAWRTGLSAAEAERLFQEACALAQQCGDQPSLAILHLAMAVVVGVAGECRRQLALATKAARIADQSDYIGLRYAAKAALSFAYYCSGLFKEAHEVNDRMLRAQPDDLRIGAEITGFAPYLHLRMSQGYYSAYLFDLDTADSALRDVVELAKVHRADVEYVSITTSLRADVAALRGDGAAAVALAREALETGERIGSSLLSVYARVYVARAHLVHEEWGDARRTAEEALTIARERRAGLDFEAFLLAILGEAELGAGDPQRARRTAIEAVETAERRGTSLQEIFARLALAKVLLASADAAEAQAIASQLDRALALVERTGTRALEPFIGVELARLARLQGDETRRERELREAHRRFLEIGAPIRAAEVARELERLF